MNRRSLVRGIFASVAFLTLSSSALAAGHCDSFGTKRYTFDSSQKQNCQNDGQWSAVAGTCANLAGKVHRFQLEVAGKCADAHQVQEAARQYCETLSCRNASELQINGVRFKVSTRAH